MMDDYTEMSLALPSSGLRCRNPKASLNSIPDETLMNIFYCLPSVDLARSVQRLNRRCHRLSSEPKLWLARCRGDFAHWTVEQRAQLAAAGRANTGPWKDMWVARMRGDARSGRHFERVLRSKVHRVHHIEAICRRGLNARDYLLAQFRCADDLEDVLARRYYASTALSSINRSLAIEEWCKVRADMRGFGRLDRALGAFDMFVLGEGHEDMDEIQRALDQRTEDFRQAHPDLDTMTTRQKALALARWVRAIRLVGMSLPDVNYRNVRNCLLGHALLEEQHCSLPIVSSAMYVCIAQRIDLRAYCCAVPGHVHSTILAGPGQTVDDTPLPAAPSSRQQTEEERFAAAAAAAMQQQMGGLGLFGGGFGEGPMLPLPVIQTAVPTSLRDNGERMFVDVYSHANEVRLGDMRSSLAGLSWPPQENKDELLMPTPTSALVLRVALNIEASWTHAHRLTTSPNSAFLEMVTKWVRHGDADMNLEALLYSTLWASAFMTPVSTPGWDRHLENLLKRFAHFFSEDAWIVERYLAPLYEEFRTRVHPRHPDDVAAAAAAAANGDDDDDDDDSDSDNSNNYQQPVGWRDYADPRVIAKMVRNLDRRQPLVSRRYRQDICDKVQYRVGQVFRHRRFHYVGIINGWTPDNPRSLPPQHVMGPAEVLLLSDGEDSASASASGSGATTPTTPTGQHPHPRPKSNAFYTCLRAGAERQTVAQRNIEIITDPRKIPDALFFLAGRNFKRFDHATCTFVSNIREFYPDD